MCCPAIDQQCITPGYFANKLLEDRDFQKFAKYDMKKCEDREEQKGRVRQHCL